MVAENRLRACEYDRLRRQILQRDAWHCQACGRRTNLQVHHLIHSGRGGSDSEKNLISLCTDCHRCVHGAVNPLEATLVAACSATMMHNIGASMAAEPISRCGRTRIPRRMTLVLDPNAPDELTEDEWRQEYKHF
jgi:HNH endonuclease